MLSPSDPNWHQSTAHAGLAACWKLEAGRAHGWRARTDGVLRITRGQAWATLDEAPRGYGSAAGDHCLGPGQALAVRAGRHLVIESLDHNPVHFEWQPQTALARARRRWAQAVAQPLADLRQAAALAGLALLRLARGLLCCLALPVFRRR